MKLELQRKKEKEELENKKFVEKNIEASNNYKIKKLYSNPKIEVNKNNSEQVSSLFNQGGNYMKDITKDFDEKLENMNQKKSSSNDISNNESYDTKDNTNSSLEGKNFEKNINEYKKPIIYSERVDYVDRKLDKYSCNVNPVQLNFIANNIINNSGQQDKKNAVLKSQNYQFNKLKPNYEAGKKKGEAFMVNFSNEEKIIKAKPKIVASKTKIEIKGDEK